MLNSMKHGLHQTVNNEAHYYKTLFNIALILEWAPNYNNFLREQANMDKSVHVIQNNMITEEIIIRPRMSATEKEHTPNFSDDNNVNDESKATNEDK